MRFALKIVPELAVTLAVWFALTSLLALLNSAMPEKGAPTAFWPWFRIVAPGTFGAACIIWTIIGAVWIGNNRDRWLRDMDERERIAARQREIEMAEVEKILRSNP